jgi:hypothetical protein
MQERDQAMAQIVRREDRDACRVARFGDRGAQRIGAGIGE